MSTPPEPNRPLTPWFRQWDTVSFWLLALVLLGSLLWRLLEEDTPRWQVVTLPDTPISAPLVETSPPSNPVDTPLPEKPHADPAQGVSHQSKPHPKAPKKAPSVVHLNTANATQLETLPGVGPKMAQRILAYRKGVGHFTQVEELMDVKGIGPKTFAKMKPFLRL